MEHVLSLKCLVCEICEQLGWNVPDRVFVSVGDGSIIGGLHKGLKDLLALGWIDRMPKLMGVQAAGSSFMYSAWNGFQRAKPLRARSNAISAICRSSFVLRFAPPLR